MTGLFWIFVAQDTGFVELCCACSVASCKLKITISPTRIYASLYITLFGRRNGWEQIGLWPIHKDDVIESNNYDFIRFSTNLR